MYRFSIFTTVYTHCLYTGDIASFYMNNYLCIECKNIPLDILHEWRRIILYLCRLAGL